MQMNATFVISNLDSGGAERVLSTLCNYLAHQGFAVTLITLNEAVPDHYAISSEVHRVRLQLQGSAGGWWRRRLNNVKWLLLLRKSILRSSPDVVVSFMDAINVITLLSTFGTGLPVIISERVDPRYHNAGFPWNLLRPITYRRAAALVIQTEAVRTWAGRVISPRRVHVIPNPAVSLTSTDQPDAELPPKPFILGIGRLSHQKGFDVLIRAFARCGDVTSRWRLAIIGKGEEEERLKLLAREVAVADRVHFLGTVSDVGRVLSEASLFVLPSRYEGFPNALMEAMAAGTAVITTDCPSGPAELVEHRRTGLIVPPDDVDALSAAIEELVRDASLRARLADAAPEILDRLSLERVGGEWKTLLSSVRSS